MLTTQQTLLALRNAGEDFEWYPTTDEILRKIAHSIRGRDSDRRYRRRDGRDGKMLDIGAGDGRVMLRLQEMLTDDKDSWRNIHLDPFAIEKSTVHLGNMPKSIVVIGTDFFEQTLVDKEFDIVFCNPPYSEYEDWTYRILKECDASDVYLVIPRRWRDDKRLTALIADLGIEAESLGEFDFEHADRRARARVEIVRFKLEREEHAAFDAAIEEMLPELDRFECTVGDEPDDKRWEQQLAEGGTLIESLVTAYEAQQAELYETYRGVVKINPAILKELGVTKANILAGLREKIKGLKNRYWEILFEHLSDITKRFATKQRRLFLDSLASKTVIDFTHGNVLSMLIWIAKWSSDYCDEQVVDLFKAMAQKATVERYKSNQKVWNEGRWRYLQEEASHYKLCYRMVLETHGGIVDDSSYNRWDSCNGLANSSCELLADFITVANNLGFECWDSPRNHHWASNSKVELWLRDGSLLMDVRAFKNGNLHIRVSKQVMLAINVQAGKLLGWLHSGKEAVQELQPDPEDVPLVLDVFEKTNRIEPSSLLKIGHVA